ncbi:MAG: hypothetical protein ACRDI1_08550 [Actinomycetota bacterium]
MSKTQAQAQPEYDSEGWRYMTEDQEDEMLLWWVQDAIVRGEIDPNDPGEYWDEANED